MKFRQSKRNNSSIINDTKMKLHIYLKPHEIQIEFHEIPYIGYLVMAEDKKTDERKDGRTDNTKHIPVYYIPITDTTLELSVFWSSDTESRINELRFSESMSLSFKTRLTSVTSFCGDVS